MAKIPFVVQPRLKPVLERIGNDDVGYIEIERRGFLSVSEKAFVQAALDQQPSEADLYSAISRIAAAEGKQPAQVVKDIELLSSDEPPAYLIKYSTELGAAMDATYNQERRNYVFVTAALLRSRVDSEIDMDEIMELHPDILAGFYQLYLDEDKKATERLEEKAKESEKGEASEGK